MVKYQEMLRGGYWTNIKFQHSILDSLRTCTTVCKQRDSNSHPEDDTMSWGNFLFISSNTTQCHTRLRVGIHIYSPRGCSICFLELRICCPTNCTNH
jgi:hypothetical protein